MFLSHMFSVWMFLSSLAEFFFVDTYFPEFNEKCLDEVIDKFYGRDRRFGGINDKKRES